MASLNKVMLIGNLTRDPEVRFTQSGAMVGEMGLAMNRVWFDKETREKKEEVTFADVTVFGKTAGNVEKFLRKGSPVYVEGRLQLDTWVDKSTGKNRQKLKVVAETVQFLPDGRDRDRDRPVALD